MTAENDLSAALAGCDDDRHPSWARHTRRAIRRLAKQGVTTVPELLAAFPSLTAALRAEAVYLLGRLGRKRDVPVLVAHFDVESSDQVRQAIVEAVGQIGGKRAMVALQRWVAGATQSDELRVSACHALMFCDCKADEALLEGLLRVASSPEEDPDLRGQAIETLTYHVESDDDRSIDRLLDCLRDPAGEVRFWAIYAMGQLHVDRALPALRRLVRTDDFVAALGWKNREEARDVVHYLTTGEHLDPDAYERMVASRSTPPTSSSDS